MKITNLSLAAIAAVAMTTGAMADMDFKTTGQAVVYYQTMDGGDRDLFDQNGASANAGLQINLDGEVNGLSIGLQGSALSTVGLEGNLVDNQMQSGSGDTVGAGDYFAITQAHFGKKIGNTSLKLGRQELPKSLSPFAFSEGWNVFKNTFDAALAINSDIPDTTLVGAYVHRANKTTGDNAISSFTPINPELGSADQNKGVYMLTAQNKSIDGVTLTGSYYDAESYAKVAWLDAKVKMAGLPVGIALQGGQINPDKAGLDTTTAYGAKLSGKAAGANLSLAYSTVDDGAVAIDNLGTGVKTPLYTQMVLNQWAIKKDADTFVLKGVVPAGAGKLIAQYGMTTANKTNILGDGNDYQELDVMYKFNLLGGKTFVGYIMRKADSTIKNADGTVNKKAALMGGDDTNNVIRVWTRYNF